MSMTMNLAVLLVNEEAENYAHWMRGTDRGFGPEEVRDLDEWHAQTLALLGADLDIVGLTSQEVYRLVHFLHERDWHIGTEYGSPQYPIDAYLADRLVRFVH